MKTFVGYGYNVRDQWIKEMIFPIIEAFDDEVIHGCVMPGEQLAEGVKERIRKADAVIGFNTRRVDPATGQPGQASHVWVVQELGIALGLGVPRLEVREKDGNPQLGIAAGVQYLEYDAGARDAFLVRFVENYGELRRRASRFALHLMPHEFSDALAPFLSDGNLHCFYRLMDGETFEKKPEVETEIIATTGGLFIRTGNVAPKDLISLRIECGPDFRWTSKFQAVETRVIHLSQLKK